MHWEKKICIRLTIRRIVVTILAASAVTNLIIAGTVFGADSPPAPTITPLRTMSLSPPTALIPISGSGEIAPLVQTDIPDITDTPGTILTDMLTPTQTPLDSSIWTMCIKKFYWAAYRVQTGDTLFSLALATGSSVKELMLANCLLTDRIDAGQTLYVPRLPENSASSTPSSTPSAIYTPLQTSTDTLTAIFTPTDTPTTIAPTATHTATATSSATPTISPNSPPSVSIVSPTDGSRYQYSGFDRSLNLWFSEVVLQGSASDPEDGVLGSSSLIWSTDFSNSNVSSVLGNGTIVKAILYSNICTGIWHTITFSARDNQGQESTTVVKVFIGDGQLC